MNRPFERSQLESVRYWSDSEERRAQHFYVSFCLLMSSIQDALLGKRELRGGNLNWSATCSYYSLVHVGRLLFFLPFGDFPTQHERLRSLLNPDESSQRNEPRSGTRFPFTWLRDFAGPRSHGANPRLARSAPSDSAPTVSWKAEIVRYLGTGIPDVDSRVSYFGKMISRGSALRNDSNYEALLIAHEYQHNEMTEAFEQLAGNMVQAAACGVRLGIDAFRFFLNVDSNLSIGRDSYKSFVHTYVNIRIRQPLLQKLESSQAGTELIKELDGYLTDLRSTGNEGDFRELEVLVSMSRFEGKTGRMRRFRDKVDALAELVRDGSPAT